MQYLVIASVKRIQLYRTCELFISNDTRGKVRELLMIRKNTFIAETAVTIYASMFANPERDPSPEAALQYAEDLWKELENKSYPDKFGRIGTED